VPGTFNKAKDGYLYYMPDPDEGYFNVALTEEAIENGYYFPHHTGWVWIGPGQSAQEVVEGAAEEALQKSIAEEQSKNKRKYEAPFGHPSGGQGSSVAKKIDSSLSKSSPSLSSHDPLVPAAPCKYVAALASLKEPSPSLSSSTSAPKKKGLVVEVGAGGGEYSVFISKYLANCDVVATDISDKPTERGWLMAAQKAGLRVLYAVDANKLEAAFGLGTVDAIVSVGCYGLGPKAPGASYGLAQCTGKMKATSSKQKYRKRRKDHGNVDEIPETAVDPRFLASAYKVLKPGGRVVMLVRNNLLFDYTLLLDGRYRNSAQQLLAKHNESAALDPKAKLGTTNLFADVPWEALQTFANIGFEIEVSLVTPPHGVVSRSIDSDADTVLKGYNVQLTCVKTGTPKVAGVLKEQPFWATLPIVVDAAPDSYLEADAEERYYIYGADVIPANEDSFFAVIAHQIGGELITGRDEGGPADHEDVRMMLTSALADRLFRGAHQDFEELWDGFYEGRITAQDVEFSGAEDTQELLERFEELCEKFPNFPDDIRAYVPQLIWTSGDVAKLRTSTKPGRPQVTISGDTVFLPYVVNKVFRHPVHIYYLQGETLCRVLAAEEEHQGEPIRFLYDGRTFTTIEFAVDPATFVHDARLS
jgi:SAM-dependent methyltransferase